MMNPNLFNICYSRVREGATPRAGDDKHFNTKIVEVPPSPLPVEKGRRRKGKTQRPPPALPFFFCVWGSPLFSLTHTSLYLLYPMHRIRTRPVEFGGARKRGWEDRGVEKGVPALRGRVGLPPSSYFRSIE